MSKRNSLAQIRVLKAIDACSAEDMSADSWGEVWTHMRHLPDGNRAIPLEMKNFDRASDALIKRGLIEVDGEYGTIAMTDAGRRALAAAKEERA